MQTSPTELKANLSKNVISCHSQSSLVHAIVRLRVVLKLTAVDDWRFDNPSGRHLQSQVKSSRSLYTEAISWGMCSTATAKPPLLHETYFHWLYEGFHCITATCTVKPVKLIYNSTMSICNQCTCVTVITVVIVHSYCSVLITGIIWDLEKIKKSASPKRPLDCIMIVD